MKPTSGPLCHTKERRRRRENAVADEQGGFLQDGSAAAGTR